MSTAAGFRRIALSLEETVEAPHFDRKAFKVARIYATLAADGRTANLKLSPDEQALKCTLAPEIFSAVPNAFGLQGWTTVALDRIGDAELRHALEAAWAHALPKKTKGGRKSPRR